MTADDKAPDAFRTISEVAKELEIPQHVLRFWESKFAQVKPMKRGGNRRYYRPEDLELLRGIRQLLYGDGYSIKGVQRIFKEQGPTPILAVGQGAAPKDVTSVAADAPEDAEAQQTMAADAAVDSARLVDGQRLRRVLDGLEECLEILKTADSA